MKYGIFPTTIREALNASLKSWHPSGYQGDPVREVNSFFLELFSNRGMVMPLDFTIWFVKFPIPIY